MEVHTVYWWEHSSKLGQFSSAKVHRSLTVEKLVEEPKSFDDYRFTVQPLEGLAVEHFGWTGKDEDDYLMLSGIQHFQFCKRQWALIHIEQQWAENVRTVEGRAVCIEKADQPFTKEKRGDKLVVRAMPVKSYSLNFTGSL